jgi:predicted RNA binding protein YcfA (HicA-like mRNA interferase family)
MPKLPSVSPQQLAKVLEKDGFVLKRVKGGHHTYYHPQKDRITVIPFHSKDLDLVRDAS